MLLGRAAFAQSATPGLRFEISFPKEVSVAALDGHVFV